MTFMIFAQKQKKESKDWYIAATHYLTAGFVVPLVAGLLEVYFLLPLLGIDGEPSFATKFLDAAVFISSIWLGVKYSANYVKKTYLLPRRMRIVNLSSIYFAVIVGIWQLIQFGGILAVAGIVFWKQLPTLVPLDVQHAALSAILGGLIDVAAVAIGVIVFYLESKRRLTSI
jgi:hypothetical protein